MAANSLNPTPPPDPETLINEFRDYSEKWAQRINRAPLDTRAKALALRTFDELLTQVFAIFKTSESLPARIHTFIESNLHKGLTLQDLSEYLGYSEKYCSELFHTQMGETFSVFLKRIRIEKAKLYLQDESLNLTMIAESIGFKDQFAFSHFFKKVTGHSPRDYRNKHVPPKVKSFAQ